MAKKEKIDLDNKEFNDAWKLLRFTRQSVFLTGRAGSGKSTFLRYITSHTRKRHVILAPTGISAVNVGGVTIHSFFRLPLKPVLPDDPDFAVSRLRERMKYPRSLVKLIKELELIVIDEISMVRADTIDLIDRILRVYSGNMRLPFGGKQLLLVGDIFQLEPVVTSDMRLVLRKFYPSPFFFNANAFAEISVVPIELQKVYRQTDDTFISLLDRVRLGRQTRADVALINSRCVGDSARPDEHDGKLVMTLATRREIVDHINESRLAGIRKPEFTFTGVVSGDFPETSLPTPRELVVKEGAQIVFIKNDRERRWVNGTIGTVKSVTATSLEIELEDGTAHDIEPEVWSNIRYEYDEKTRRVTEKELGTYTQYPVRLAWALTIHKSQGLTFSHVNIDMGQGAFSSGQSYVALSRCRSLEGLTMLSTLAERDIYVNPAIVRFSSTFNDNALIDRALSSAKADDLYATAASCADNRRWPEAFDALVEALRARSEIDNPAAVRLMRRKVARIAADREHADSLKAQLDEMRGQMSLLAGEYVSMGDDCVENGMLDAALANYDKALSLSPACVPALIAKGRVLVEAGDVDGAVSVLVTAVELAPEVSETACLLSRAYAASGDGFNALDVLLAAGQRMPQSSAVMQALADRYADIGNEAEARRYASCAKGLRRRGK